MAESVITFLVKQLSVFLYQDYKQVGGGLRREVQHIKDELGSMRALLRDAESKEDTDSELQEWVKQVREAAYETEDVLDEFILRFASHRAGGFYGRVQMVYTTMKNLRARHQISVKIKDIKNRVESISDRHQRYKLEFGVSERGSSTTEDSLDYIRGNALLLEEANLVGIHRPKSELIAQIINESSHLKAISVVGMGGLGKTTLVKRVYEDRNVKQRFSRHAWITVSQRFHMKELFKNLVQQLFEEIKQEVPSKVESMDGDELRALVKNFLDGKSFIIVLDDIWSIDSWDVIKYAFPDSGCGSRVVLTTRIIDVATVSCKESGGHLYKMKPLSAEESWTLFCRKTFEDNCCPLHLEDVSRGILYKCEGLPLAIVAIGGLLAAKDTSKVDEWEMVRCSLGGNLEGSGKLEKVKKILLLSYSDLPYYLKICLLYTSIFPEDFQIMIEELIPLWIAEGFIQEREGETRVEVAKMYLNQLTNRSLIQVASTNSDGTPKFCSVHDLVRMVILSKLQEHEIATVAAGHYTKWPESIRRLVIHDFTGNTPERSQLKHLRSLIIFGNTSSLTSSSLSEMLRGGPKLLTVLDLGGVGLKKIPVEVFKLFRLKFLNLRGNQVKVVPRSIRKLQNLEYLNLLETDVTELSVDVLKLGKLRELRAYNVREHAGTFTIRGFKAPFKIGMLVSLQCLLGVDADNENVVREIGKLTELRELGVTKLRGQDGKEFCSSLEKLSNLRKLSLSPNRKNEMLDLEYSMSPYPRFLQVLHLGGRLEKLPNWVVSLQALTELYLYGSRLKEDPLKSVQGLPNLEDLTLNNSYEGDVLHFKAGEFQKLKRLDLMKLERLRWIIVEEGSMPHLNELKLANCQSVEELPHGIQNLSKLEGLGFYGQMSEEFITKVKNLDRHGEKIGHVPNIVIGNWRDGKWEVNYL